MNSKRTFCLLFIPITILLLLAGCGEKPDQPTPTLISPTNTPIPPTSTAALPTASTGSSEEPFELAGVWKTDDLHAPDNSWDIPYSVYFQFANAKQYVYHGTDVFNSNQPTDVSDIVYLNTDDATFIKKFVIIPDHPEALGKFQKWTWKFDNGNVLFTVYGIMDSQELALNDTVITALATGVNVPSQ